MDWTSYASSLIIAVFFAVATVSSASAYFYSQTPESRQTSECGEAGCFYDLTVEDNQYSLQYDIATNQGSPEVKTATING